MIELLNSLWLWYESYFFWWHFAGIIGWVIFLVTAIVFEKRRYHFLWACYYALLFIFDFFAGFLALVGSLIWLGWHLWEYFEEEIMKILKTLATPFVKLFWIVILIFTVIKIFIEIVGQFFKHLFIAMGWRKL